MLGLCGLKRGREEGIFSLSAAGPDSAGPRVDRDEERGMKVGILLLEKFLGT